MYYSSTWGPDGPNSFVMVPKETSKRTGRAVSVGNKMISAGRVGVPVVGGLFDFKKQVEDGEDVGDAAVKATAHVGIGIAGGKAGLAIGAAIGSGFPIAGTIVGGAVGFLAGVAITAVGSFIFDEIYDNRKEIYEGAKNLVSSAGETISKVGESIGDAVSGWLSGLGTAFG